LTVQGRLTEGERVRERTGEWGQVGSDRERAWEWVDTCEGGWAGGGPWAREAQRAERGLWAKVGLTEGKVFSFLFFNLFSISFYIYTYI
jgi:hypothetical protein